MLCTFSAAFLGWVSGYPAGIKICVHSQITMLFSLIFLILKVNMVFYFPVPSGRCPNDGGLQEERWMVDRGRTGKAAGMRIRTPPGCSTRLCSGRR